jgi:FG-GAP-like repeat
MRQARFRWLMAVSSVVVVALGAALSVAVVGCSRSPGVTGSLAPNPDTPTPNAAKDETVPNLTLDETQRDYLWQIEHYGNVLSKRGFGAIKTALAKDDAPALAALLAADFTGALYGPPREVRLESSFVQVSRRQEAAGQARQRLDKLAFVELLRGYRRLFRQPPAVAMNLMKLSPEEAGNLDSRYWKGGCLLRMSGEAAAGEPAEVSLNLEYQIPKPTEATLDKKGWLHQAAVVQSVVGHAQRFLFRDVTSQSGIDPKLFYDNWLNDKRRMPVHGGMFVCDFNRDGILDVLVTDTNGYFLFKGLPGGKFEDVTRQVGLPRQPINPFGNFTVAAFADLDGDGWEDLILGSQVYRNEEGKRFVDYTYRSNLRILPDAGGLAIADYDRDGKVDLYVTHSGGQKKDSWLGGKAGDKRGNQLWRNLGNWQFENVTYKTGTDGGNRSTFTAIWLDVNNDGWPDLYVINEFGNGVLLVNNQDGTFKEQQLADGPNDFGTMGVTCGDIDNDENIDIYCANMYSKAGSRVIGNLQPDTYPEPIMAKMRQFVAGSQLWRNKGNLQFQKLGQQCQVAGVGWAYGATLADLNNDGWLDLYATAGFMSMSRDEPDG